MWVSIDAELGGVEPSVSIEVGWGGVEAVSHHGMILIKPEQFWGPSVFSPGLNTRRCFVSVEYARLWLYRLYRSRINKACISLAQDRVFTHFNWKPTQLCLQCSHWRGMEIPRTVIRHLTFCSDWLRSAPRQWKRRYPESFIRNWTQNRQWYITMAPTRSPVNLE